MPCRLINVSVVCIALIEGTEGIYMHVNSTSESIAGVTPSKHVYIPSQYQVSNVIYPAYSPHSHSRGNVGSF